MWVSFEQLSEFYYLSVPLAFLRAAVWGSFLGMLVYRLPRIILEEGRFSLWHPPSFCVHCHHKLRMWDNLPILGFLVQKGRCRHCGAKISLRYPALELLMALLSLLALWLSQSYAMFFMIFFWFAFLVALAWIDAEHGILPDEINGIGFLVTLSFLVLFMKDDVMQAVLGVVFSVWFMFLMGGFGSLVAGRSAIGMGDVKLMGLIGLLTPLAWLPYFFILASLLAMGVYAFERHANRLEKGSVIYFGPYLSFAAIVVFCVRMFWERMG